MPDLSILGGDRSGVDNNTPLAINRFKRQHARCGFNDADKCADLVYFNNPAILGNRKLRNRAGFIPSSGFIGVADTSAVNQYALLAMHSAGFGKTGLDAGFIGDIDLAEHAAKLLGHSFAGGFVHVEERDLGALCGQCPRCFQP